MKKRVPSRTSSMSATVFPTGAFGVQCAGAQLLQLLEFVPDVGQGTGAEERLELVGPGQEGEREEGEWLPRRLKEVKRDRRHDPLLQERCPGHALGVAAAKENLH